MVSQQTDQRSNPSLGTGTTKEAKNKEGWNQNTSPKEEAPIEQHWEPTLTGFRIQEHLHRFP